MLSASVYIAWCSTKNRARVRLKRLREPRYLLGAIAGGAYLYFTVFGRGQRPGVRINRGRGGLGRSGADAFPPQFQVLGTALGGLAVMVMAALVWVLPARSGLLEFSQAETEFLFTAPVSRRQLLVHRIVRSQISALIASLFIAIFATPFSGAGRMRLAVGMWAVLVTMRIYYAAVALTRARLRSPLLAVQAAAWLPIGALVAGLAIVGVSVARQITSSAAGFSDVMVQVARVTASGLPHAVLWPFIAILRPPFAQSPAAFGTALFFSLLVLAGVTAWLLAGAGQLDAVLEQGSEFRVEQTKPAKPGQRPRTAGLRLAPAGRPDVAFVWKNATQTIRAIGLRELKFVPPALLGLFGIAAAVMAANGTRGPAALVAAFAVAIAGAAVVFGPQMVRSDLRGDFEHLDLLKTWPVRAADVIRGEMAWPVLLVSSVAWGAVLVAALFSVTVLPDASFVSRWSFALAAAFAGPALIAAQFAVHNAATIFFPAWVQIGTQRTRGIDAMGQRLIMLAAIVLSLALFALPGAIAGGVVWFVLHRLIGDVVYVPAAVVFAVVVLVEVLMVTELLGPAYERIDVTSVERAE